MLSAGRRLLLLLADVTDEPKSQPLSNPENRKVCLKWKSKNDVDTEGAMKIRELPIHFLTKRSSMMRWLETTAGLGCILNRIDLSPQPQPLWLGLWAAIQPVIEMAAVSKEDLLLITARILNGLPRYAGNLKRLWSQRSTAVRTAKT
jgi:hypothetical protein